MLDFAQGLPQYEAMPKRLISPDKGLEVLRPYIETIQDIVHGGKDDWFLQGKNSPRTQIALGPTARADCINDWQVERARRAFKDSQNVSEVVHQGFVSWVVDLRLAVRFKKFRDGSFRLGGWETEQAKAFDGQEPLEGMPPKATYVVVGYRWNQMEDDFRQVAIVCKTREQVHWYLDITTPGADNVKIVDFRKLPGDDSDFKVDSGQPESDEGETGSSQ